jgi:flagellar hook-associated protein 2
MSTAVGSFPGLGSTFDYTSLVDQLISLQSQPGVAMQNRITTAQAQLTAYKTYSGLLSNLETATSPMRSGTAFRGVSANVSNSTAANGQSILSASALSGAAPGSYAVKVLQTAQAEKLSGATFASGSAALGIAGDFLINGKTVTVNATDTLASVRDKINAVNSGSNASGVTAAIVTDSSTSQRLVLTSAQTGASGINLVDGAQGVAQQLGWVDSATSIKHVTSAGAQSDNFASATASIGSQLGLSMAPGIQTVTIAGHSVSVDLASDSLTSLASSLSVAGIQATVQSTTVNGSTKYYLDVRNTTSFVDGGNALQQLGVLTGGRSSVAQQIQGSAMTAGDTSTPATATTLLTNLWNAGSAAGAQAGDTLTIAGVRGDGSAVNVSFTVGAGSTMQDVLDKLNDPTTGFGAGTRPATASIDASGRIVVSDGTTGQSSLSLQMVANNQGGGRLDFGSFATSSTGRARELVAGSDAKFTVDGVGFTRSSNTVSDVIANTTLSLTAADPNVTATVSVALSTSAAQSAVQNYVSAYNSVVDYIKAQQAPGADPSSNPTLYNDTLLRTARSALSQSMLTPVAGAASDMSTPDTVGISITADGHLSFDASKFQGAFASRYNDVTKLFMESGATTNPALVYTASTTVTQPGDYAVNITQAGSQAQILGSGFSGVYNQPGAPDTITVTDTTSNTSAQIQLVGGMTTAQIVTALTSSFGTPQNRGLQSSVTLNDVTGSAPATSATLLSDVHLSDGTSAGVVPGYAINYSGTRSDGTALTGAFTIGATSTIADFVTQLQANMGSGAAVSFANGRLSVQSATGGASPLALAVNVSNGIGDQFDFGTMDVTAAGHGVLSLTATAVGNQIQIQQNAYGASAGIAVAYSGTGNPASQLGIAAATSVGTDVQGTIGGYTATGSGRQLVGAAGTPVEGLSMAYMGTVPGAIGSISLTQGFGSVIDRMLTAWTQTGGSIDAQSQQINDTINMQQKRLTDFTARIALARAALLKEYSAMDSIVSQIRAQGNSFLAAFSNSSGTNTNSAGNSTGSGS